MYPSILLQSLALHLLKPPQPNLPFSKTLCGCMCEIQWPRQEHHFFCLSWSPQHTYKHPWTQLLLCMIMTVDSRCCLIRGVYWIAFLRYKHLYGCSSACISLSKPSFLHLSLLSFQLSSISFPTPSPQQKSKLKAQACPKINLNGGIKLKAKPQEFYYVLMFEPLTWIVLLKYE